MNNHRTFFIKLFLVTLLSLFTACSGGDSKSTTTGSSKNEGGIGGGGSGGDNGGTTPNSAPSITQSCAIAIKEQAPYSCTPSVVDSDAGNSHTWSFDGATHTCTWLSISSSTGAISGHPSSSHIGNCTLAFKVSDGRDNSNTATVSITVSALQVQAKAYIKVNNNKADLFVAERVAVSGDLIVSSSLNEPAGETTITNGSTSPDNYGATGSGAAYVFERINGDWTQVATLKAPNSIAGLNFSNGSVDVDGDTIVVGSISESSSATTIYHDGASSSDTSASDAGAVYVFRRVNGLWTNEAYIKAPNAEAEDRFGKSVAISGDVLAVGAPEESNSQSTITNGGNITEEGLTDHSGAVYTYKRTGSMWAFEAYIKSSINAQDDEFGGDIGLDGDTLVVGTYNDDNTNTTIVNGGTITDNDAAYQVGAAHVYRRSAIGEWSFEAYLKAPNAGNADLFGGSVAIDEDTIVVGAAWEDNAQSTVTNGGTINETSTVSDSGAAYVFTRTGSTWSFQSYLKAPNRDASDRFGEAVAISKDLIIVSSVNDASASQVTTNDGTASNDNSAANAGAVYLYARNGTDWEFKSYIKAPNAVGAQYFGERIAIDNGTIVVGAPYDAGNQNTISNDGTASNDQSVSNSGAVFVFDQL